MAAEANKQRGCRDENNKLLGQQCTKLQRGNGSCRQKYCKAEGLSLQTHEYLVTA
jgi:hypothetical protein